MSNDTEFRNLVEALPVGVVVHRDRRILYLNRVCLVALGLERLDQVLGRDPIEMLAGQPDAYAVRAAAVMRGEAVAPIDARLTTKSGRTFALELSGVRVEFEGAPANLTLVRDVTAEREAQAALSYARERGAVLAEENRRVLEINRLKSEFLANISHEVRTPLNAIVGFADLLHSGEQGPISDTQRESLEAIVVSSRHLLRLINDVLDLARIESGKLAFHPESVDLRTVVSEVVGIFTPAATRKDVAIGTDLDPQVTRAVLDPGRLRQVVYNYLSNAVKFTDRGGRVTVRTRAEGEYGFRIEVEDTGVGIRPEDLERLFVEFRQLDAGVAKKYGGTGMGLALTRRIVEAQGGQVGAFSEPGKGSTFYAVLPLESPIASTERQGDWQR